MARESLKAKKARAAEVYDILFAEYPDAHCELAFQDPFQLGVATILSAQTTDVRVNMVTPELFRRFPTPEALASADRDDLEGIVRTTGFFRNKSKNIIGFARGLMADHGGRVPSTIAELSALPGVGRKTANVILGNAFGIDEGVVVDTHVGRLSRRLALTDAKDAVKVERDLMELVPRTDWTLWAHLLIYHGRQICHSRRPDCAQCMLIDLCPSAEI